MFYIHFHIDTNERSIYNIFKTWYLEVHIMDNEKEEYREKIIEMVKKIENVYWLRSIYIFIKTLTE